MRTHYCGELNSKLLGEEVSLCGWVHNRRDHGGVIFIDLRDFKGKAQIVIDPDTPESFSIAENVRSEYVLKVTGVVRERPKGTINEDMPTGSLEVLISAIIVLNASLTPMILDVTVPSSSPICKRIFPVLLLLARCTKGFPSLTLS